MLSVELRLKESLLQRAALTAEQEKSALGERIKALTGEVKELEGRLAISQETIRSLKETVVGGNSFSSPGKSSMMNSSGAPSQQAISITGGASQQFSPASTIADAQGRVAREIKLRQASECRRQLLEEEVEKLQRELQTLESERMKQSREVEEARHTLAMVESLGQRAQRAEILVEELRRGAPRNAPATLALSSEKDQNPPSFDSHLSPLHISSLQSTLLRVITATRDAVGSSVELLPDFSSSLLASLQETTPPQHEPLAHQGVNQLCLKGNIAASAILEFGSSAMSVVQKERDIRVALEKELEDRAKLIRDWQKYAEHWESRGRDAENLVGEWKKAYDGTRKETS